MTDTKTVWIYADSADPFPTSMMIVDSCGIPIGIDDGHDDDCSALCECKN